MLDHAAELRMTADKVGAKWTATIDVSYRELEQAELVALEDLYFTFFAGLGDAMHARLAKTQDTRVAA